MTVDALPVRQFKGGDGLDLAYRETGEGRPLVLIHGYFSTAHENWVRYGHAALLAGRGHRVIMPDLRGHGSSGTPHDPAAYPRDILAEDGFALLDHLGLAAGEYDLGGYSLGGRTTARMLARGAKPGHAVIAGMGLEGLTATADRGDFFRRVLTHPEPFPFGTAEWRAQAFLKTIGGDPEALVRVLDTFVDTPRETLAAIDLPVLVLTGVDDNDNGSAEALAALLPRGVHAPVPGNHMSAVIKPELGAAIADFLDAEL